MIAWVLIRHNTLTLRLGVKAFKYQPPNALGGGLSLKIHNQLSLQITTYEMLCFLMVNNEQVNPS